jgi:ABC-2 type transport system permease protein
MNIFLKELRDYRKALIFWSIAIIAFMLSAMSKYQGYQKSGTSINELISSLPAGLSAVLGFKGLDLQGAGGFYAMCALYLGILLGVHAVLLGSGIVAKEETDKTIEFLNARPVSRTRILFAKLLAAFAEIVFLNLFTALTSVATVAAFNDGPPVTGDIVFLMPSIFLIQLWFLIIGAAFAAVMRNPKHAGMYSAAVLLATFIISAFVDMTDRFSFLRYATPFKYFDPKTVFSQGRYETRYLIITAVAIPILLLASRFAYRGRDLKV